LDEAIDKLRGLRATPVKKAKTKTELDFILEKVTPEVAQVILAQLEAQEAKEKKEKEEKEKLEPKQQCEQETKSENLPKT